MKVSQSGSYARDTSIIDENKFAPAVIVFLLVVFGLVARLWHLQVIKGRDFSIASERNRAREVSSPAPRGLMFDRNKKLLLDNRPFFDLVLVPQYLHDKEKTLKIVAEMFNISQESMEKRLQETQGIPKFVPIRIKRNLSLHEVALVESNKFFLPGLDVDTAPRRDYVRNDSAHFFGYLGEVTPKEIDDLNSASRGFQYRVGSVIGKLGVEKKFESLLRGTEGKEILQVDALGRLVRAPQVYTNVASAYLQTPNSVGFNSQPFGAAGSSLVNGASNSTGAPNQLAQRGLDIELTLNDTLQRASAEAFRGKNGAIIALNPQTGEVLAYLSHPNFNLNVYQDGLKPEDWQILQTNPFKPLLDKTTGGAYPPGSTFKVITAIAALEENIVGPERVYNCNGAFHLGNARWRCWKKEGHGPMNLRKALENSCDIWFYQVGNLLGVDRIAKWSKLFGLGEKSGLDLNMELPGIVPSTEWKQRTKGQPWQSGDTINVSIGQGFNLTTPMQILGLYAAIGNGGHLMKPYLLKEVRDSSGNVVAQEKPVERRFVSMKQSTLDIIQQALLDVVETGTAKKSQVKGFTVAGKTGTAQTSALRKPKEQEDIDFNQRDHAWYVAYSPAKKPEIAVVVLSEFDGGHGGSEAAPIAQKVLEAYWRQKHPEKFAELDALAAKKEEEAAARKLKTGTTLKPTERTQTEGTIIE